MDSIRGGGHGFSGIAANAYPNLVTHALQQAGRQTPEADCVQRYLTDAETVLNVRYPLSAPELRIQSQGEKSIHFTRIAARYAPRYPKRFPVTSVPRITTRRGRKPVCFESF